MKRKIEITVRGKSDTWGFVFQGDPKYLEEWLEDGLEVSEVLNTIPLWAQQMGLTHIWCRVQDVWRWLRVW